MKQQYDIIVEPTVQHYMQESERYWKSRSSLGEPLSSPPPPAPQFLAVGMEWEGPAAPDVIIVPINGILTLCVKSGQYDSRRMSYRALDYRGAVGYYDEETKTIVEIFNSMKTAATKP